MRLSRCVIKSKQHAPSNVGRKENNQLAKTLTVPKFDQISTVRDIQKYSSYPRTIVEWNSLMSEVRRIEYINYPFNKNAQWFFNTFL